jgi:hypothetical protein
LLDQSWQLGREVLGHALLVTANAPREGLGVAIADCGGERLDAQVDGDLDVLLAKLLLGVAHVCLGLLGDERADGAHLALDGGDRLTGSLAEGGGDARRIETGGGHAADLLDPPRYRALVLLGLLEVRLEPLLVGRLLGQLDVGAQIGLELGFLGVGLVEPLHELCVPLVEDLLLGWHVRSWVRDVVTAPPL